MEDLGRRGGGGGEASDLGSQQQLRPGSAVTAVVVTSLTSGNPVFPGVATADNFPGAHPPEAAGQGLTGEGTEPPTTRSGPAPSNTHGWTPLADRGLGWRLGLSSSGCKN